MKLSDSLKYSFYILSHPFDGFWVLKSEKKGTIKSATVLFALFIATLIIRVYSTGYVINGLSIEIFSVWLMLAIVIFVFMLYCVANWALTTLFDGKGRFTEVYISLCYATLPVTLVNIPLTIVSNVITIEEASFYTFFNIISILWMVFLMLAANLSTHDYTMTKSIITFLATVFIMFIIVVLLVLFGNLIQQVYIFVLSIVKEIAFRL